MNWSLIFWNALYTGINAAAAGYCLIAAGLNVHVGYTGLLNFGQAGFAAIGAYAFAIPIATYGWEWYWALPLVFVGSIALALLLGLPTLRLRADYLAIVTIAAAEIIRLFLNSVRFTWLTGGTDGRNGWTGVLRGPQPVRERARYKLGAQSIDGYRLFMMLLGWSLVALDLGVRLGPDAQPVGTRAEEHPRGRGRRPRARQERRSPSRCRASSSAG